MAVSTQQTPVSRTLDEWIAEAQALHDAGKLEEGEQIIAQVLAAAPNFLPALHLGGILSFRLKRPLEAIKRLEHAVTLA
ncbi:MAG: hypothetical protein KGI75_20300, partial [Rhizobiaceae bacterium]|nr:hypothetical protein [Rhizobiaceae bacterium]